MAVVTQVAFQLDESDLDRVDAQARAQAVSRAHVLRLAVRDYLARAREAELDAQIEAGYRDLPPGPDDDGLAEVSQAALKAADLAW